MTDGQQRGIPGAGLDVRFSHVVIAVTDMDRSVTFYRDVASGHGDAAAGSIGTIGVQEISLSVPDVDAAYQAVAKAVEPATKPFDVDGVRMFFVADPDGATVEFVEFPGGARTPAEMHRGVDGTRP